MYRISEISDKIYRVDPWNIPVADRIEKMKKIKQLGKQLVVYFYPTFDSSTFRYRGYNVCETLDYSFEWGGVCFQMSEIEDVKSEMGLLDVVVLIRCPWTEELETFINEVKRNKIPLVYDVDDLVYSPKYFDQLCESLGFKQDMELNFWHGLMYRNEKIIGMCDAMTTTNDYLGDYLRKDYNIPCYIIPNYLNLIQEEVSQKYLSEKMQITSDDIFEIGYFSGSPTHAKDLQVALPAIETLMSENKDVRLKIVGYMELNDRYQYLVNEKRIIFEGFKPFTGLQYEQAKVNVNIVPLIDNVFANCKSELKFFETAIVGTLTLAAPTYTYLHAIESGKNGYICRSEDEWYDRLLAEYKRPLTSEEMVVLANDVLDKYSHTSMVDLVEQILTKIVS